MLGVDPGDECQDDGQQMSKTEVKEEYLEERPVLLIMVILD